MKYPIVTRMKKLTPKQKVELNKRLALIKSGKAKFTTLAEIKAKYKQK